MSPSQIGPEKSIPCPICRMPTRIEAPAKFECLNCQRTIQVTVATDRVKGPIVWLAGNSSLSD